MFYCFEAQCLALVEDEFEGDWWQALVSSLDVIERLTGEEVLQYLA